MKISFYKLAILPFLFFISSLSAQNFGADFSLVNQHPLSRNDDPLLLNPQSGIKIGYSFMDGNNTMSNVEYFGFYIGYLFPVTNTFTAPAMTQYGQDITVDGKRKSSFYSVALRMSFPVGIARTEFFNLYFGLDAGFMGGSSIYSYTLDDPTTRVDGDYPDGKIRYGNFLINPYLGANYELEKFSIFAEAGYRIGSIVDFVGDKNGALTFEAGIHYPLRTL